MENIQFILCVNQMNYVSFIKKEFAESTTNKEWKQLNPYITLRNKDKYLLFKKPNGQYTIGIKGYINIEDWRGNLRDTFVRAFKREALEKIGIIIPDSENIKFDTKIALVESKNEYIHIGYSTEISVSEDEVEAIRKFCGRKESEFEFVGEKTIMELNNMIGDLENWSQCVVLLPDGG